MKIKQLLTKIDYINFIGKENIKITSIVPLGVYPNKNTISWCSDKYVEMLINLEIGTYIISNSINLNILNQNCNYIIVENPRLAFQKLIPIFHNIGFIHKISKSSKIHRTAIIGLNVHIGENVVVEKNCKIGNNTIINHNTVIFQNTKIGSDVIIGSNNTIGGVGFGYEKDNSGLYSLIPHIGNVIISDNVEIGNNCTIDKAVLGSTLINSNVKIDNLVHIAHGVIIGKNSIVIANSMIAGSVVIGEDTWVSPSVSILNKIQVGSDCIIGMGAVVIRDVQQSDKIVGNPAKSIK